MNLSNLLKSVTLALSFVALMTCHSFAQSFGANVRGGEISYVSTAPEFLLSRSMFFTIVLGRFRPPQHLFEFMIAQELIRLYLPYHLQILLEQTLVTYALQVLGQLIVIQVQLKVKSK